MSKDDEIKKFVEIYKMTFPVGRENVIAGILSVRGIPVTVFVAKDGRIVKRHVGAITSEELVHFPDHYGH
jgi:thioredoxin-like negative regulator of GroEL